MESVREELRIASVVLTDSEAGRRQNELQKTTKLVKLKENEFEEMSQKQKAFIYKMTSVKQELREANVELKLKIEKLAMELGESRAEIKKKKLSTQMVILQQENCSLKTILNSNRVGLSNEVKRNSESKVDE